MPEVTGAKVGIEVLMCDVLHGLGGKDDVELTCHGIWSAVTAACPKSQPPPFLNSIF